MNGNKDVGLRARAKLERASLARTSRRRRALAIVKQGMKVRTWMRALIACKLALATAFFMLG